MSQKSQSVKIRDSQNRFAVLLSETRNRLDGIEREKQRVVQLREEAMQREEEEREIQRLIQEQKDHEERVEHMTKEYFDLNKAQRKVVPHQAPKYFGENDGVEGAWHPNGFGSYFLDGEEKLKGSFRMGNLNGRGIATFNSGEAWNGRFVEGRMHGTGCLRHTDESLEETIVRNDVVICRLQDLRVGTQVELLDPSLHISTLYSHGDHPKATLTRHIKKWRWDVRMHDPLVPRSRQIDFATLSMFRVLKNFPLVYNLSAFGVDIDVKSSYSYAKDVFSQISLPRYEIAVGRRNPEMRYVGATALRNTMRSTSDHTENIFESEATGVGAAKKKELEAVMAEQQRKQWLTTVNDKRAEEEKKRLVRIGQELAETIREQSRLNKLEDEGLRQEINRSSS